MSITGIRAARAYVELVMNDSKFMRGLALAESEMRAFANKCTSIGTQAFGAGAAMLTPITFAVKQFKEFDDTMRLVRAVTRATMTDFQKLSDKARLLGKTTSFTSQQVADAMANLGRAGFDTRQIDGMIKHVMNLARATQTGIANSAEIVGNAMRQFGLETKDTQRVVDVLTTTANNSSQTLDDIAQSMKYAAPVAKEFKMAIEETAYYIGILANQGLKGEMAGTSLRNMLIRLSGADVEKQFTEQLNVKIRDAQGRVKNIKDLLHEANDAMNERGWDTLQRSGWLRKVFGLRAIAGGTKFLSVGDDFKYIMDAIADSEGAAERTAKQMDEGIGGAIRITISAFQELANVVGEAVTPELMELGKWLQGVANDFITFLKYNRGVVVAWMKTAGFIAKWGGMLFVVGSAVRTLGTAFGGLVSAGKNLAAYFKAFQKDTGNLDAEMTAAGSATRKAGADFSEASAKIYDAGQKIVKTAELTAKAGAAIEKASASVQKAGTSAERASVPVKAAAQNFEAATVAARAAATAFGKISKETMAIGAAFKKSGEPMVAALKAFRQIVGFYAKSGEAVGNAVSQIGALANILTQLATSSEAAAAALGVAGPEITVQTKEMAIAGRQAAKSIAAFRGATQASSRSVKSFGETVAAADRATAGFAGKAAETAVGVGAIGDAAAKSAAEVKALQGAMAGTANETAVFGAVKPMPLNKVQGLIAQRSNIDKQLSEHRSNLANYYGTQIPLMKDNLAKLKAKADNTPLTQMLLVRQQIDKLEAEIARMEAEAEKVRNQIFSAYGRRANIDKQLSDAGYTTYLTKDERIAAGFNGISPYQQKQNRALLNQIKSEIVQANERNAVPPFPYSSSVYESMMLADKAREGQQSMIYATHPLAGKADKIQQLRYIEEQKRRIEERQNRLAKIAEKHGYTWSSQYGSGNRHIDSLARKYDKIAIKYDEIASKLKSDSYMDSQIDGKSFIFGGIRNTDSRAEEPILLTPTGEQFPLPETYDWVRDEKDKLEYVTIGTTGKSDYGLAFTPGQDVSGFKKLANESLIAKQQISVFGRVVEKAGVQVDPLYNTLNQTATQLKITSENVTDLTPAVTAASNYVETLNRDFVDGGKSVRDFGKSLTVSSKIKAIGTSIKQTAVSTDTVSKQFYDWNTATTQTAISLDNVEDIIKDLPKAITTSTKTVQSASRGFFSFSKAAKTAGFAALGFAKSLGGMLLFSVIFEVISRIAGKMREMSTVSGEMQENLRSLEGSFAEDTGMLKRLIEINKEHEKSNALLDEARTILSVLQSKYGDLGLSVNQAKKEVEGLVDEQKKLNELNKAQAEKRYVEQGYTIDELKKNRGIYQKKADKLQRYFEKEILYSPILGIDVTKAIEKYGEGLFDRDDWKTLVEPYALLTQYTEPFNSIADTQERKLKESILKLKHPVTITDDNGRTFLTTKESTRESRNKRRELNNVYKELQITKQQIFDLEGERYLFLNGGFVDLNIPVLDGLTEQPVNTPWRNSAKIKSFADIMQMVSQTPYSLPEFENFDDFRHSVINAMDVAKKNKQESEDRVYALSNALATNYPDLYARGAGFLKDNTDTRRGLFGQLGWFGRNKIGDNKFAGQDTSSALKDFQWHYSVFKQQLLDDAGKGSEEEQTLRREMLMQLDKFRDDYLKAIIEGTQLKFDFSKWGELASYEANTIIKQQLENLDKQIKSTIERKMKDFVEIKVNGNTAYKIYDGKTVNGERTFVKDEFGKDKIFQGEQQRDSQLNAMAMEEVKAAIEQFNLSKDMGNLLTAQENLAKNLSTENTLRRTQEKTQELIYEIIRRMDRNRREDLNKPDSPLYNKYQAEKDALAAKRDQNKAPYIKQANLAKQNGQDKIDGQPIDQWLEENLYIIDRAYEHEVHNLNRKYGVDDEDSYRGIGTNGEPIKKSEEPNGLLKTETPFGNAAYGEGKDAEEAADVGKNGGVSVLQQGDKNNTEEITDQSGKQDNTSKDDKEPEPNEKTAATEKPGNVTSQDNGESVSADDLKSDPELDKVNQDIAYYKRQIENSKNKKNAEYASEEQIKKADEQIKESREKLSELIAKREELERTANERALQRAKEAEQNVDGAQGGASDQEQSSLFLKSEDIYDEGKPEQEQPTVPEQNKPDNKDNKYQEKYDAFNKEINSILDTDNFSDEFKAVKLALLKPVTQEEYDKLSEQERLNTRIMPSFNSRTYDIANSGMPSELAEEATIYFEENIKKRINQQLEDAKKTLEKERERAIKAGLEEATKDWDEAVDAIVKFRQEIQNKTAEGGVISKDDVERLELLKRSLEAARDQINKTASEHIFDDPVKQMVPEKVMRDLHDYQDMVDTFLDINDQYSWLDAKKFLHKMMSRTSVMSPKEPSEINGIQRQVEPGNRAKEIEGIDILDIQNKLAGLKENEPESYDAEKKKVTDKQIPIDNLKPGSKFSVKEDDGRITNMRVRDNGKIEVDQPGMLEEERRRQVGTIPKVGPDGFNRKRSIRYWPGAMRAEAKKIRREARMRENDLAYEMGATPWDDANADIDNEIRLKEREKEVTQRAGNNVAASKIDADIKELEREKVSNEYQKYVESSKRLQKRQAIDARQYQKDQRAVEVAEKYLKRHRKEMTDEEVTAKKDEIERLKQQRDLSKSRLWKSTQANADAQTFMNAYETNFNQMAFDVRRSFSSHGTFDAYETGGQDVQVWTAEFKEQTAILGNIEDYLATMASGEYL
ncbi:MAG: phage tail tape measure protein [Thermoguttaceae bacterium]|nr:phage tail tape measure protein [Thermoguttaceae bacterium]